jgi:serine/threonine protein kinase
MITEFASQGSLFDIIRSGNPEKILDENQIYAITFQIASAMWYIHSKKLLHCDLKSQNILLTGDHLSQVMTVKVIDFGLTRYQERFKKDN